MIDFFQGKGYVVLRGCRIMDVIECDNAGFVQDEEFCLLQILLLQTPQQIRQGLPFLPRYLWIDFDCGTCPTKKKLIKLLKNI